MTVLMPCARARSTRSPPTESNGGRKMQGVKPVALRMASVALRISSLASRPPLPRSAWVKLWFWTSWPAANARLSTDSRPLILSACGKNVAFTLLAFRIERSLLVPPEGPSSKVSATRLRARDPWVMTELPLLLQPVGRAASAGPGAATPHAARLATRTPTLAVRVRDRTLSSMHDEMSRWSNCPPPSCPARSRARADHPARRPHPDGIRRADPRSRTWRRGPASGTGSSSSSP